MERESIKQTNKQTNKQQQKKPKKNQTERILEMKNLERFNESESSGKFFEKLSI